MQAYAVKAAREGKQQTSWLAPDERYEAGLKDFLRRILDRAQAAEFIASFDAFARRAALIGALNSLTQLALKATIPGVPDFYQGTEFWDLSLVDPDNRRPVDFAARAGELASLAADVDWQALASAWPDGRIKFALGRRLLAIRKQFASVFTHGSYQPLAVEGPDRDESLGLCADQRAPGRDRRGRSIVRTLDGQWTAMAVGPGLARHDRGRRVFVAPQHARRSGAPHRLRIAGLRAFRSAPRRHPASGLGRAAKGRKR